MDSFRIVSRPIALRRRALAFVVGAWACFALSLEGGPGSIAADPATDAAKSHATQSPPVGARIEVIAGDWSAPALRRIAVARATASSSVSPETSEYAPARAVDGDRRTKWAARVAPTEATPQWIALELFDVQEVSAVAVFGERLDNDGVLAAEIQWLGPNDKAFRTAAVLRDARSPQWLATFPPTAAKQVRLAILRSGGPSPHTDVYEVEVYGRPLSPEQLRRHAAERLESGRAQYEQAQAAWATLRGAGMPAAWSEAVASLDARVRELAERFARWDSASPQERLALASELERFESAVARIRPAVAKAAATFPLREAAIAGARRRAQHSGGSPGGALGEKVVAVRQGGTLLAMNRRVCVALRENDGTWDATWLGPAVAVHRVGLAVTIDGRVRSQGAAPAESAPLADPLGSGIEIRQRFGTSPAIERSLRVYDGGAAVVVACRIVNSGPRDVALGEVRPVHVASADGGWWHLGSLLAPPSAVGYAAGSPPCRPAPEVGGWPEPAWRYGSGDMLALAPRASNAGLVLGALAAREGAPSVGAAFEPGEGGTAFSAAFAPRTGALPAGRALALDPVWLGADASPWEALDRYGAASAASAVPPVRTGANALWCSWYPIRMGISEKIVLEHAEIVARHFQPLGMDILQLDHGWQQGDICGDWTPNERFPHGLAWLAEQLRRRWGLKLGLWIAPTQVAFTSRLFREHPEWLLHDAQGKPVDTGRWYWIPNPSMALLDASKPEAARWIEQTFARLSAEGAVYYKIDFIAGSPALDRAMAAIRRGAGSKAWIRYCQTPPLLSAGLADSAYIGADTGDAGLPAWMQLARDNAPLLAASYWADDRLYHREVCDMSVGPKADIEEARFRLALMTLSGCSIAISDDLRTLDPPRIRMIQQCLPPGNPTGRPLDLFQRELPSLWHVRCRGAAGAWDVVGVFNFEDQPQQRTVDFAALGIAPGEEVAVFEFWEEKFLGVQRRQTTIRLAPRTARVLVLRRMAARPQLLATNMHILAGLHEIRAMAWDETRQRLSGNYRRAPGLEGKAFFYVPDGFTPQEAPGAAKLTHLGGRLWMQPVRFDAAEVAWSVPFVTQR